MFSQNLKSRALDVNRWIDNTPFDFTKIYGNGEYGYVG